MRKKKKKVKPENTCHGEVKDRVSLSSGGSWWRLALGVCMNVCPGVERVSLAMHSKAKLSVIWGPIPTLCYPHLFARLQGLEVESGFLNRCL